MSSGKKVPIEKLEGRCCFACGTANPIGLNLQFYQLGDAVCSDITLGKYHEGWQNMVHGGIISTLLDEVMSWTIIYFKKVFFVTRKMEIKYVNPVLVGTPLTVKGMVRDESELPRITVRAEIRDDKKGRLLVRSKGEFVILEKERLSYVANDLKEDMLSLFRKFG